MIPPKRHRGQYKDDNEYDHAIDQGQALGRFYGQYSQRHYDQAKGEPTVVDNCSVELRDKTTAGLVGGRPTIRNPDNVPCSRGRVAGKQNRK